MSQSSAEVGGVSASRYLEFSSVPPSARSAQLSVRNTSEATRCLHRIRYSDNVVAESDVVAAGALLQLARIRTGLSKSELARRAGVPRSEIYEIESGRRQPSLPVLMKILRGAGLELRLHLDHVDNQNAVLDAIADQLDAEERARRGARHERNVAAFANAQPR